jgi:hypothetical protein
VEKSCLHKALLVVARHFSLLCRPKKKVYTEQQTRGYDLRSQKWSGRRRMGPEECASEEQMWKKSVENTATCSTRGHLRHCELSLDKVMREHFPSTNTSLCRHSHQPPSARERKINRKAGKSRRRSLVGLNRDDTSRKKCRK